MEDIFATGDELGPLKVIHVQEPSIGLKAALVIDNVALGPSIGGVRMAPDVSTNECARLARAMTLKSAAAGLNHGGGKSVLYGDSKMLLEKKEQLIRGMACALRDAEEYIFAPDMGTDEGSMAWIKDEIGRVVGLPREIGGIPLDQVGATGWGLSHVAEIAAKHIGMRLEEAKFVIQGFGAVGKNTARFLGEKGAILVATADSKGSIYNENGLDVAELVELKKEGKSVIESKAGVILDSEKIVDVECDIWIPAARPDIITEKNMHRLKTKLVVEGANIPITYGAEKYLHEKGVLCVPDIIANAGGVICAAAEYQGKCEKEAFVAIEEKLRANSSLVLEKSRGKMMLPRDAAVEFAIQRVKKAMGYKRWRLF